MLIWRLGIGAYRQSHINIRGRFNIPQIKRSQPRTQLTPDTNKHQNVSYNVYISAYKATYVLSRVNSQQINIVET